MKKRALIVSTTVGAGLLAWTLTREALAFAFLFWTSITLLGYTFSGYPLLIRIWARVAPRPWRRRDVLDEPSVTVLVVAFNEAARISARLRNLLALDYPRERLALVLASDGSSDRTVEEARRFEGNGIRVLAFPVRRGKPSVLNEVLPRLRSEVVILADARQRFEPDTVRKLVAPFADPTVGAVSGELVFDAAEAGAVEKGVGAYWSYERSLRRAESAVDSTVGATGACYAIRRSLFSPLPPDTILDDVVVPLRVVERGLRVVFEPGARVHDVPPGSAGEELSRKARTIAGGFQLFARQPWLLRPDRNRLWFQTFSHKALRLLTPALLLTALGANILLATTPIYRLLLAGQVSFYALALVGHALGRRRPKLAALGVPYVLCLMAWATVVGFWRFLTSRQPVTWTKVVSRAA